ncbi:MAG: BLUF domain-containing protein [Planctomycetota bacterium]
MAMGHLLYISDAVQPITEADLESIRISSLRNNMLIDVTGVLFYSSGHFVQLLEGDRDRIHKLYHTIEEDARHCEPRVLVDCMATKRIFSEWSMGLLNLDTYSVEDRAKLDELVALASQGDVNRDETPVEMEILSRFCMLLPVA